MIYPTPSLAELEEQTIIYPSRQTRYAWERVDTADRLGMEDDADAIHQINIRFSGLEPLGAYASPIVAEKVAG